MFQQPAPWQIPSGLLRPVLPIQSPRCLRYGFFDDSFNVFFIMPSLSNVPIPAAIIPTAKAIVSAESNSAEAIKGKNKYYFIRAPL